jgi:hypothetical protein
MWWSSYDCVYGRILRPHILYGLPFVVPKEAALVGRFKYISSCILHVYLSVIIVNIVNYELDLK